MTEYVVNPDAAHAIVRAAEDHAEGAADAADALPGDADGLVTACGESTVGPGFSTWFTGASDVLSASVTRAMNATGAAHAVIETLELADLQIAQDANSTADSLVGHALDEVDKGMSR